MIARVGNDVVDLADPESAPDALHPRFDSRVFAAAERAALAVASDSNRERWKRWAAKEAAYKLARKCAARTIFSPSRFVTELAGDDAGRVTHLGDRFDVIFRDRGDAIHAVAVVAGAQPRNLVCDTADLGERLDGCDPEAPRIAVRELLCGCLSERLQIDASQLEVRSSDRIPSLWSNGRRCDIDVSLSHHGRFVAFACAWDGNPKWSREFGSTARVDAPGAGVPDNRASAPRHGVRR